MSFLFRDESSAYHDQSQAATLLFSSAEPEPDHTVSSSVGAADASSSSSPPYTNPDPGPRLHSSHYYQHADDSQNHTSLNIQQQHEQSKRSTKDDIVLGVVLPIVLIILFGISLRHCCIVNRRHAEFHERRQSIRAAERARVREQRRLEEKSRKARAKEIEKALISKTASKCKCETSLSKKRIFGSTADLSTHTNITDDMSQSSSNHDIENPADESSDEAPSLTCAICLEAYVGGKDKVSWSKFQTCRHAFHHSCIHGWLSETKNGNCPCCRGPYLKEEKAGEGGEAQTSADNDGSSDDASPVANEQMSTTVERETSDEGNINQESVSSAPEDDIPTIKAQILSAPDDTKKPIIYSEFCIVHGLKRDTKNQRNAFSFKPIIDEPAELENV